jgi:hypothetical protein
MMAKVSGMRMAMVVPTPGAELMSKAPRGARWR